MKTINEYLDDLKEKTGSDYKSAKLLEIERSSLSVMRRRGQISDETALRIANALKIDKSELLFAAAVARSEGEVKKAWETAWENISKRTGMAASIFISASLGAQGLAALSWMMQEAGNKGILYIM
jgi:chromosome condensin MukBEF MukE localization factor